MNYEDGSGKGNSRFVTQAPEAPIREDADSSSVAAATTVPRSESPHRAEAVEESRTSMRAAGATLLSRLVPIERLKRHRVGQALLLYIAICWLVIQPVNVLFRMLGASATANRMVVFTMIAGLPVVMAIAWSVRTNPANGRVATKHQIDLRRLIIAGAVVVAVVFLGARFGFQLLTPEEAPGIDARTSPAKAFSVAILPIHNLSVSRDGALFADGLTDNVTTALTSLPGLLVVAPYSVASYRDTHPDPRQVGREQGVSNVVTGSVQWIDNRIRIAVQMMDATSGRELWSERYDRTPADVLEVQDEIAMRVAVQLQARLTEGEQARLRQSGTRNLDAWRLATQGYEAFARNDPAANADAQRLLEEAVRVDPGYPWAWSALGSARQLAARFGFTDRPEETLAKAEEAYRRAIALDPNLAIAHASLGVNHLMRGEFALAEASGRKGVALAPGSSEIHALLAQILMLRGRFREAIAESEQAVLLSPRHPSWYLIWKAWSHIYLGETQLALDTGRKMLSIAESPNMAASAQDTIAFALVASGHLKEARAAVAAGIKGLPGHSLDFHRRTMTFEDPANTKRFEESLIEAGLPE